jgi:hydroxymethylglutaryl-CoA lyase
MKLTLVECPRDAMQGMPIFIPTHVKVAYINTLLKCGFDVLDCGSFVSAKAIPQMTDTHQLLNLIDEVPDSTKLLTIVANSRGALEACAHHNVSVVGFPFSVSEEFQKRNTNKSRQEAFDTLKEIQNIAAQKDKEVVAYISMAFGNHYQEIWSEAQVFEWVEKIAAIGIKTIALSDTVGVAQPQNIQSLFTNLIPEFPQISFGAHFHTRSENWEEKLEAAIAAGCKRFDGAIKGFGGCPMAADKLTGNMPTENIISFAEKHHLSHSINISAFNHAVLEAEKVFS